MKRSRTHEAAVKRALQRELARVGKMLSPGKQWGLRGPGHALYGWWVMGPLGPETYLGPTLPEAHIAYLNGCSVFTSDAEECECES